MKDLIFERLNHIELGKMVSNADLVAENIDSIKNATSYQAVWCRNLREIFSEASKTGIEFENFVDIGSGKGKACFYASNKFEFKSIAGVEFSGPLVEIANKNRRSGGFLNVQFLTLDATEYSIPNGNTLVFMFNPFNEIILERFLEKNRDHFQRFDSLIAYANDIHRRTLIETGFETIFRNQSRKISLFSFPKQP